MIDHDITPSDVSQWRCACGKKKRPEYEQCYNCYTALSARETEIYDQLKARVPNNDDIPPTEKQLLYLSYLISETGRKLDEIRSAIEEVESLNMEFASNWIEDYVSMRKQS